MPHFEKMLYDNSQLATGLHGGLAGDRPTASTAEISRPRSLAYVAARDDRAEEGGFYSTTDADSEGHEGKFFVWTKKEIQEICGDDADVAIAWYGVTDGGNFEGKSILTGRTTHAAVAQTTGKSEADVVAAIERSRAALYAKRETRVHPHLDDKVLSS